MSEPTFPFPREDTFQPPNVFREIRRVRPISKVRLFDGSEAWLLTKHRDIRAALSAPQVSADNRSKGYPEIHEGVCKGKGQRPTFVNLDDPAHDEQRSMIEPFFNKDAIERLTPLIRGTVTMVLNSFQTKLRDAQGQPVDLVEEFAAQVPTQIVLRMLGVPDADVPGLSQDTAVRTGTSRTVAEHGHSNLRSYMEGLVEMRIQSPQNYDIISMLVRTQYRTGKLAKEDMVNLALLVLTAGNAAITNSIALGVITLLQHPDQLRRLIDYPSTAPQVVNELLRYNTASAFNTRRCVRESFFVDGHQLKKGEGIICAIQIGDRCPTMTQHADTFDPTRQYDPAHVLGLGYGPHRCQGEWLVRAELEAVFSTVFAKLPGLTLAVEKIEDLKFTPPTQNIGVLELPVRLVGSTN